MAMKIFKPDEVYKANTMSSGTITDPKVLARQVELALHTPSTYLAEQQPVSKHRSKSKCKPGVDKARVKSQPKAKVKQPKQPQAKTKWSKLFAVNDEERHALWWDFVKDRSFLSVSYPIDPKDRAEGIRKQLNSQRSRADIQALQAVGITPHGHDRVDTKKIGSVCHEADPAFKQVVDENGAYLRELSVRYCLNHEIESSGLNLRARKWACYAIKTQLIDNSRAIEVLEEQLSPKGGFIGPHPQAADKRLAKQVRAEAVVFDIEPLIGPVENAVTQSANESVFDKLERQYEYDQHPLPINYAVYEQMCMGYLKIDTDLVGYVNWHNEAELRFPTDNQFLVDLKTWAGTEAEIHGRAYLCWLEDHYELRAEYLREKMEWARRAVDSMYDMDLGTFIHPLEQTNPAQYDYFIDNLRTSSAAISRKCLHMETFGEWYVFSTYAADANPMRRRLQEKNHADINAFYERQEALAELIVDQALEKLQPPVLTDVVEETTQEELPTIDSEVDPISDDKETEVVSNVIDLLLVKKQRAADVQQLIDTFKFNFDGYSQEEKEGARKFIVQLYEALG